MRYFLSICLLLSTALATAQTEIEWLSFEEAVARSKDEPRKMVVDVYTDWCGWCKKMDKTVFTDPDIAEHINSNFYAVKLNAEQRADILYDGHTFEFDAASGRRGAHQLAVALLDGRMSFPSIVYLDEQRNRITISPGFKPADKYIHELQFVSGEHYKTTTYQDFVTDRGE